ncbi:MAG TPA: cysteine--tRNA ligase [Candidatus Paceibacterota bacterium]|jgi:cysteinyl-tRNA synthetase
MWPFSRSAKHEKSTASIFFTNTLTGSKETFASFKSGTATLYSCGPTVYSRAHIGNLRPYVMSDLIARTLSSAGYRLRRVINITDVGHLVSDADEGEDKMEKSARESGESASQIADRYTKLFLEDIRLLNLATEDILFPRATEYIKEQIALIEVLESKGLTYRIHDGIYFDTSKFPDYGKLGGMPKELIKEGDHASLADRISIVGKARIKENAEKRNQADFALWKFSPVGSRRQQEWQSPWGRGFPGWHIECSAMSKALLGETIDIHTGGMDHIAIHHNNEIAQSESVTQKPFVRYWMHNAFLTMAEEKVSKSLGNVVYLSDITGRGIHPLALRYLFLQTHYRKPVSFSWESLSAANEALTRLWKHAREVRKYAKGIAQPSETRDQVTALLRDDLGTPQALALLWETVKDESISPKTAWGVILAADNVLGLSLVEPPAAVLPSAIAVADLPEEIQELITERETARAARDFARADSLRSELTARGYSVEDSSSGPVVSRA